MPIHIIHDEVAMACGVNAAMILEHLKFWIEKNKANNKHFHNGMWWTYESTEAFRIQFPFFTSNQIRSAIDKLVSAGYIIKGNFNQSHYNRTLWYAITESGYALFPTIQNTANPCHENQALDGGKSDVGSCENQSSIPENSEIESGKNSDRLYIYTVEKPVLENTVKNMTSIPPKSLALDSEPAQTKKENEKGEQKKYKKKSKSSHALEIPDATTLFPESPKLQETFALWMTYKAQRKETLTEIGIQRLVTKFKNSAEQYGADVVFDVVDSSISSGYQGITWDTLSRVYENKKREKGGNYDGKDSGNSHDWTITGDWRDFKPSTGFRRPTP